METGRQGKDGHDLTQEDQGPHFGPGHTSACVFLSLYALGKIFSERLNSVLQNGEVKRTERPEIAFHSITNSISSDVKAPTSSKGDVSPKVTLAPFSFKL